MPDTNDKLTPYLSSLAVWALAIGTSIGWGSVVVTCSTYIVAAGPAGTVLGIAVGAAVMLVIARNFCYMMNRYPEAGGAYAYSKHVFGYDHGFMISWFLLLVYLAIFWANATSIPLFGRYFIGDIFQFGYLYTVFGYDVYLGEGVLTMLAIAAFAFICTRSKRIVAVAMMVLALVFTFGIIGCFVATMTGFGAAGATFDPPFLPDSSTISQVVFIASASPWAFIGFENISNSVEEFSFPRQKAFRILVVAIVVTTVLYACVTLMSVAAFPARYDSWVGYISDLKNLQGIEAVPAFYAAYHYLGNPGVAVLLICLAALVMTSLIANLVALSRLVFALARDSVFPRQFAVLNKHSVPSRAIAALAIISLVIPFIGRTAIGWIVDITNIGATLVYCVVSSTALRAAREAGDKTQAVFGWVGLAVTVGMGLVLLMPGLAGVSSLAPESYIMFAVWAILGFLVFRVVLQRDGLETRFGKSMVVWIALLSLMLITLLLWVGQADQSATQTAAASIAEYLNDTDWSSTSGTVEAAENANSFIEGQLTAISDFRIMHLTTVIALVSITLVIMLSNMSFIRRREGEKERMLGEVQLVAYNDPVTGVGSKQAFVEHEDSVDELIVRGGIESFAVVVADVNGLKHVNDTRGHKAGDDYLNLVGKRLGAAFPNSPAFRVGGDEFAVTLQGADYERRHELVDALDKEVESSLKSEKEPWNHGKVIVALGMAEYLPGLDKSMRLVFERADANMYVRKQELKHLGAYAREKEAHS